MDEKTFFELISVAGLVSMIVAAVYSGYKRCHDEEERLLQAKVNAAMARLDAENEKAQEIEEERYRHFMTKARENAKLLKRQARFRRRYRLAGRPGPC